MNRKSHWEKIYKTKQLNEVSWFQPKPTTSLDFIQSFHLPKSAKIIDIGGGDSLLVDHLLEAGYTDITVLDISAVALARAKKRLGSSAGRVHWIEADVTEYHSEYQYDFWHDRAAFHFLTREADIRRYLQTAKQNLTKGGIALVGTFSESGPQKCSGLNIRQYSASSLSHRFSRFFKKIKCITVDHLTPFDTVQNFVFCSFKKIS